MIAMGIILLAILGWCGMWLFGAFSTPPQLLAVRTEVDQQIAQLEEASRNGEPFSPDTGSFTAVFATMREVPEAYRDQAREQMGRLFEARETAEVDSFFAVPPEKRAAELDRRIEAEETRRKAWAAERTRRDAQQGNGGATAQSGRATAGTGQTAGQPGGGRRRGDGTEESRNMRSKSRIDKTSAESRARNTEYRRLKDQRRIQLGLEPSRR